MKIGIVAPYASPEIGAAVVRLNGFQQCFQKHGHDVQIFAPDRGIPREVIRYSGIRGLMPLLMRNEFSIVMGISPLMTHNVLALMICKLKRIPFVLDSKDPFTFIMEKRGGSKFKLLIFRFLEKFLHKHSSHIFTTTARDGEYIQTKFNINDKDITVIMNGTDTDVVRKVAVKKLPYKTIVYMGVVRGRGIRKFLKASSQTIKRNDAHLLFIFACDNSGFIGSRYEEVKKTIKELSLEARCRILVNLPYTEIHKYLSEADIAINIIPDYWSTNLPAKVFDYLAAELPLATIAPKKGSMRDFYDNYGCGFFSSEWEEFVIKLDSALKDDEFQKLGKIGREIVKKNFSRKASNEKAVSVLEGLVK